MPLFRLPINQPYGVAGLNAFKYATMVLNHPDSMRYQGISIDDNTEYGSCTILRNALGSISAKVEAHSLIDGVYQTAHCAAFGTTGIAELYAPKQVSLFSEIAQYNYAISQATKIMTFHELLYNEDFMKITRVGANNYRLSIKEGGVWVDK